MNDEEMTEGNEDGNHNKTLKVMYEVSEDEGASSEEKEIKGEHPSPDVNADVALEDEERSHEARETDDQSSFDENEEHVGKKGSLENYVETPNEICEDEVKNSDGYQSQEPEVIKLLFRGSFSENSGEIIENINKINKICFGNDKMDGFKDFSNPENQSCVINSTSETPVEYQNLIDSDDGSNVKTKESQFGGNILEKLTMLTIS